MDFGRILQLWAVYTGRKPEPPLTREVWDEYTRRQKTTSPHDASWWAAWGLKGPRQVMELTEKWQNTAVMLYDPTLPDLSEQRLFP